MNSKDQHRNATVNDRLDALAASASEFADATAEKFEKLEEAQTLEVEKLRTAFGLQLAHVRQETKELLEAEHSGRVHADANFAAVINTHLNQGFWKRLRWLFLGR